MPAGVVDALKEEWMSEALVDIGNPKEGRKLNRMTEVACPEGHGVMLQKSDPEQPHIWLEHCPVCEGVYLDAGEFTDLKYLTVVDWVKKLVAKPRG